ncbi:MAG: hypothetical protein AAB847_01430 [Patescibacteria group bacterium]
MKSRRRRSEQARQVFADLLPRIEKELKLLTPKSPCCNAPTYINVGGQICSKCGRPIQTTI